MGIWGHHSAPEGSLSTGHGSAPYSNGSAELGDFWLRESNSLESLDLKTTNDGESATSLGKLLQWLIILPV